MLESLGRNMEREDLPKLDFTISFETVAAAVKKSQSYSLPEIALRFDDVAKKQPVEISAALQLIAYGVPPSLADHALKVLLVLFECFESVAPDLPIIGLDAVQAAFSRTDSVLLKSATKSKEEKQKSQQSYLMNLKEYALVAFVTSYLQDNIRGISLETELVRQSCWVMLDSYVVAYHAYLDSKKGVKQNGSPPRSKPRNPTSSSKRHRRRS